MDRTVRHGPAERHGRPVQAWSGILARVSLDEYRSAFLDALLARDSARARRAVEHALEDGVPIPDIYLGVLEPALREVGHRWAMGAINVAEEHYATAVAQSILDGLGRKLRAPPKDGRLAIVSGTPEELHALGTRVVADFLEADGWEVILLGAGAPARRHRGARRVRAARPRGALDRDGGRARRRRRGAGRAARARPAAVHRRRRPVLDGRDEPDRARVRRRPRRAGPARARRDAARADPAAGAPTSDAARRGGAATAVPVWKSRNVFADVGA